MNIENLVPEKPKPDYDEVLAKIRQAQTTRAEAEREAQERQRVEREIKARVALTREVQAGQLSDCYKAMRAIWPEQLWSGASTVISHESSGISNMIGPMLPDGSVGHNANGSQDFGCFQINNFAHPGFFASHNWEDAYQNTAYAYEIYQSRGWTAWYAVKDILF